MSVLKKMSRGQIRKKLLKYYELNGIRIREANNIEVKKVKDATVVDINYELRVPFYKNVDVLLTFKNQLHSSRPHDCCTPEE